MSSPRRRTAVVAVAILVGTVGLTGCRYPRAGDSCTGYRSQYTGEYSHMLAATLITLDQWKPALKAAAPASETPEEAQRRFYETLQSEKFQADRAVVFDRIAPEYKWQEGDRTSSSSSSGGNLVCHNGVWQNLWDVLAQVTTTTTTAPTTAAPTTAAPTTTVGSTTSTTTPSTTSTTVPMPTTTIPMPTSVPPPPGPSITFTLPSGWQSTHTFGFNSSFVGDDVDDDCGWALSNDSSLVGFGDGIVAFVCQDAGDSTATVRLYVFDSPPGAEPADYNGSSMGYDLTSLDATATQGSSSVTAPAPGGAWNDYAWTLPFDTADGDITIEITGISYAFTATPPV